MKLITPSSREDRLPEDGTFYFRYSGYWVFTTSGACKAYYECHSFTVLRNTPKGCWVQENYAEPQERWISHTARRRYCYPTRALAWESFLIRQKKRRQHAVKQAQRRNNPHNLLGVPTMPTYTPSEMTEIFLLWLIFAHERRGVSAVPDFDPALALRCLSALTGQPERTLAEAEQFCRDIIQAYMKELL